MAYVAFASAKASPGVTTTVAALVATWPVERDLVVAELDPAGGDLVVRFDLASEPGLVSLAAAGRRELDRSTFADHTQPLPFVAGSASGSGPDGAGDAGARRVLVGPVAPDQAGAALAALRGGLPGVLSTLPADVLVDCGRLDPGSAAHDVACQADLLVMVARPVVAEVHHLATRLTTLRPKALSLLLVGDRPYSVAEVADAIGASPLGTLPVDDRAAAALTVGHANAVRVLRRSRLLRDARALAEGLAAWLPPASPPARPVPPVASPVPPPAAPPRPANGQPRRRPAPTRPGERPAPTSARRASPVPAPGAPPVAAPVPAGPKHFRRDRDEDRR
jgi:hypothetical protein